MHPVKIPVKINEIIELRWISTSKGYHEDKVAYAHIGTARDHGEGKKLLCLLQLQQMDLLI